MTVQLTCLSARLAVFGVLAFALGLAACGRKAGLDPPPPSAAIAPPPASEEPAPPGTPPPAVTPDGRVRKRLPIDPILD